MHLRHWLLFCLVVGLLLLQPTAFSQTAVAQSDSSAAAFLAQMSVEERVGQVFLVTFDGNAVAADSPLANLIRDYHIGGVILLPENDNFAAPPESGAQLATLTRDLQRLALTGQLPVPPSGTDDTLPPTATPEPVSVPIPLLLGLQQEGNGPPYSSLWHDVTTMPSQMSIGATWSPEFATTAGDILGRELSALGINMLIGPSLDVLENPSPFSASDLGTRAFGGDPYWVGLLGQGFIRGVHAGSDGRIAVIGKHFPGYGSSDRPLNEEVSTVRKSLEQLKQIELAPFFAITGLAPNPETTVDGLLTSHIRYQGFQGNIRATTAPVSFDPQALAALMALPEFAPWREAGGVIVSDALGVRAVQRYYDDREQEFPHRQVAKDAFLAGNDLLYLSQFAVAGSAPEVEMENIRDTIIWFQDKYRTDQSFRQRVDTAAEKIIGLKLRLYGDTFTSAAIEVDPDLVAPLSEEGNVALFNLAQAAVTLISPSPAEFVERLPQPPRLGDSITIFTDSRPARQCSQCPEETPLAVDEFASRMLALYGPTASGQIQANQIRSFTFEDMAAFLNAGPNPVLPLAPTPSPTLTPQPFVTPTSGPSPTPISTPTPAAEFRVLEAVRDTDWLIFLMQDIDPAVAHSDIVRSFLAERPDIARRTKVIVFALDAPYYLDTTEISQLTAYYGIYSKADAFIDAAVRALFQESPLTGASPVNIEGIGYDLFEVTQPNPNQIIDLYLAEEGIPQTAPDDTPLELSAGDILNLQTGVILDRNGRAVPDGTIVQFMRQNLVDGFVDLLADRPTRNGIAAIDYVLEGRSGQFRITAMSGAARNSQVIDISTGENVEVIFITLTPAPTAAPTATPSLTPSPSPSSTPTRLSATTAVTTPSTTEPTLQISLSEFQMLFGLLGGLLATALLAILPLRASGGRGLEGAAGQARLVAWGLVGSLLAYNYVILALPGAGLLTSLGAWGGFASALAGGLLGMSLPWLQQRN